MKCNRCHKELKTTDVTCPTCGNTIEMQTVNTTSVVGTICPECGYKRKNTDVSPAWKCPACEIAYHKHPNFQDASMVQISINKDRRRAPRNTIVTRSFMAWVCFGISLFLILFYVFGVL